TLRFSPSQQNTISAKVRGQNKAEHSLVTNRQIDLAPGAPTVGAAKNATLRANKNFFIPGEVWRDRQAEDIQVKQAEIPGAKVVASIRRKQYTVFQSSRKNDAVLLKIGR